MQLTKVFIVKLALWCGLIALLTATGPATAEELKELNFGIISTESTTGLKKSFEPWLAAMSKAIDIPVKGFYAPDYAGVIEAMRFNKVHSPGTAINQPWKRCNAPMAKSARRPSMPKAILATGL